MIAAQSTDTRIQSTITGDRTEMGIVQGGMAHILSILTDMYSNRILAVVREYSTNARDAQIEAGFPGPIEITLPSPLAPFFKVKDYGIGLNRDDIREIYSQYGASTKRESNDFNGMLGIGCKAALTYTSQFTVVSVKDGQRTQVVVTRDQAGASMTVVDERPTDDANGTEVTVPVSRDDIPVFAREVQGFFQWWPEGSVLVNGVPPARFQGLKLNDRLYVVEESNSSRVVMGGVAYPVDSLTTRLTYAYSVVAFVDIGEVNFAPSREALMDTPTTTGTLAALRDEISESIDGAIQSAIDAEAKSHAHALKVAQKWAGMLTSAPLTTFTYKGDPLPASIKGDFRSVPASSHVLSRSSRVHQIGSSGIPRSVWLYGYDPEKEFSAPKRRKLNQWMANDSGIDLSSYPVSQYILCEHKPDMKWIDPAMVHPWADVHAQKLPRNTVSRSGRIAGSFDMYIDGSYQSGVQADDIDPDHKLFYHVGRWNEPREYARLLAEHYDDGCTVVVMGSNRVAKFLRGFPDTEKAIDGVHALYQSWKDSLAQDDLKALQVQDDYYACQTLKALDPRDVDDPALKAAILMAGKDLTDLREKRKMYQNLLYVHVNLPADGWTNPMEKYPLATREAIRYHKDHVIRYINAEYNRTTEEV